MKKYLTLASIALMAIGCTPSTKFSVEGKLSEAIAGDSVKLVAYGNPSKVFATGVADALGNYRLEGEVETPDVAALVFDGNLVGKLYVEPGVITGERVSDSYYFGGTPLNNINREIVATIQIMTDKYDELSQAGADVTALDSLVEAHHLFVTQTINENLDNMVGVNEFLYGEFYELSPKEILERIAEFSPEMQSTTKLIEAKATAEKMLRIAVGEEYIDIKLKNTKGEDVMLSSLITPGSYTLIDFWATWCGPCMGEMPHLQEAYAEYHAKGFEIYGVSLDRSSAAWAKYADTLPWVNVINGEGDSAADDYSIRSIPSNFLVDGDGKIIATNLRGEALAEKLAEVMK